MFIKNVSIKNFRIFKDGFSFPDNTIGIPDGATKGSGLTILVGENGVGKTSILEAMALPLISYRTDSLELNDFCDINSNVDIEVHSNENFKVKRTIRGDFQAKGFRFTAKLRAQNSSKFMVGTAVNDTLFVPADGVSIDAGSPDLRTAVGNPFIGARFNDNEYLYIDKTRTKNLESGMFSASRFDRILDNFNFQYLQTNNNEPLAVHQTISDLIDAESISNELLSEAFSDFKDKTGYEVSLNFLDDALPFKKAFLGFSDLDRKQIPISKLGSGYQMFLSLICQQKLSLRSGKKLILLIDEIELHLHPKLQKELVDILLEFSKTSQIILTTHSPELLKDLQKNKKHKINVLVRDGDSIAVNPIKKYVLSMPTISETNFVAFNLASMEYFIELYNCYGELNKVSSVTAIDRFLVADGMPTQAWNRDDGPSQNLTMISCVRNKFHHPINTLNDRSIDMSYEAVLGYAETLRSKIEALRSATA
jgi:predicted ATP-dependent endonuclease of OLD family